MIRILIALLLTVSAATAQTLPALHDVTGVAADDVLNVREAPRGTAGRLGEIPHDARGVEVVELSSSGDWGRVNLQERSGWVSMRYLAPGAGPDEGALLTDHPLWCSGTEPFWTLTSDGTSLSWSEPGVDPFPLSQHTAARAEGRPAFRQAVDGVFEDGRTLTATIRTEVCSDGMSDRAYGLAIDLLMRGQDGSRLLTGCCSVGGS